MIHPDIPLTLAVMAVDNPALMMVAGACGFGLAILAAVLVLLVRAGMVDRRRNRAAHDWIQQWNRGDGNAKHRAPEPDGELRGPS